MAAVALRSLGTEYALVVLPATEILTASLAHLTRNGTTVQEMGVAKPSGKEKED
jgi:hypothetical protein